MTLVTANQPSANYHQGMAAHVGTLQNSRLKTMVIPREHGAWGMMLVPLATGAVVALRTGINGGALTLFILAAMSLFWLRTPVEAWLGTSAIKAQTGQERAFVLRMIAGVAFLAAASVAMLLWNGRNRGLLIDRSDRGPRFCGTGGGEKTRTSRPHAGASHWRDRTHVHCSRRVLRCCRET